MTSAESPVICPACGSAASADTIDVPDFEYRTPHVGHYAECGACGSFFQRPMPSFEQLGSYYPAAYHAATSRGIMSRMRHAGRLRLLAPLLQGEGALLDYGCGNGAFLLWAATKALGRSLYGYEIGMNDTVERLADGAVTIVRGRPEFLLSILPPCRVVMMNHVIEHLPDPGATITALAPFIVPGGFLQGQTPATDSLERRVFGRRWSGYHSPRHTVVFSRRGIRRLLERAGFESAVVSAAFNPAAIAVSLAATFHPSPRGINRAGLAWLGWLAAATLLAPLDLLGGRGGIMDFRAMRKPLP
jgi:hypothetical protein